MSHGGSQELSHAGGQSHSLGRCSQPELSHALSMSQQVAAQQQELSHAAMTMKQARQLEHCASMPNMRGSISRVHSMEKPPCHAVRGPRCHDPEANRRPVFWRAAVWGLAAYS